MVRGLGSKPKEGMLSAGGGSPWGEKTGEDLVVARIILTGCREKVLCVLERYSGADR